GGPANRSERWTMLTIPFGKHKGRPLEDVPTDYLEWLRRSVKLSSGLRLAVAGALRTPGGDVPAEAPTPPPARPRCRPEGKVSYSWLQKRDGQRAIRRECRSCGAWLGFAPLQEPYVSIADAMASSTPVLDTLTRAEDLGVRLTSDGAAAGIASRDWHRA